MKHRIRLVFALCLVSSLALAQADKATGTATNDETQARLRVNHCVFGGPDVDIFVNGEVAVNGDVPQTNVSALGAPGYLYLAPNTYSLAVVPTGKELSQALMGPVDVTVEAGHRYTVAVLGQADEATHQPLVIDETEAYQAIGSTPTDFPHLTVNNVRGAPGVNFTLGGVVREKNVPYGEFQAALWPTGKFTGFELALTNTANEVIFSDGFSEGWNRPAMDTLDCFGGTVENFYNETSFATSTPSAVDFLKEGDSTEGSPQSFNTLLSALETAGLAETLADGKPYLLHAPTDEAFAALPKDQLDALKSDPQAMAELLRYHIVEGYYPIGTLPGPPGQRLITSLQGTDLEICDDNINRVEMGWDSFMVRNGSRVNIIEQVLLPPE